MSFEKIGLKNKFKTLSTRYGGSLLSEPIRFEQKCVTMFFGLGGLGGRAVNEIKATANEHLNCPGRRFFTVIDTCPEDADKIEASDATMCSDDFYTDNLNGGCMLPDEIISLLDRIHPFRISDLDEETYKLIDHEILSNVKISGHGTQAIRQIGRAMFFYNGNYNRIYNRIKSVVTAAFVRAEEQNLPVKIYIVI